MPNVIVLIGAGQIGLAIARRVGAGKRVLVADLRPDNKDGDLSAPLCGSAGSARATTKPAIGSRGASAQE